MSRPTRIWGALRAPLLCLLAALVLVELAPRQMETLAAALSGAPVAVTVRVRRRREGTPEAECLPIADGASAVAPEVAAP